MFFDTHTHANFKAFEDGDAIKRALAASTWLINVGTTYAVSKEVAEIAGRHEEGVYCAIGLHPGHTFAESSDQNENPEPVLPEAFDVEAFRTLAQSEKVVAIGECGLDYYRLPDDGREAAIDKQKRELIKQLELALELDLPLTLHCRDAYADMLELLDRYPKSRGVVHSFTADWPVAKAFLDRGFCLGLNGILTFDKTGRLKEVCQKAPIESIVTETDAPYLTPVPLRGQRNEPAFVCHVADKIAEIKGLSLSEAHETLFANALRVFNLKPSARL